MKTFSCVLALVLWLVLCLTAFSSCGISYQSVATRFVLSNKKELDELAQKLLDSGRASGEREKTFEIDLNGETYTIKYWNPWDPSDPRGNEHVVFTLGSFGLVPSGVYYDFYYSPKNLPFREDGHTRISDSPDVESSSQRGYGWEWGGREWHGYTCRICENWFYSETHF